MKLVKIAAIFLLPMSLSTYAIEAFDESAKGPDFRTYQQRIALYCGSGISLNSFLNRLDRAAKAIPNVPPEEAKYLKAELDNYLEMTSVTGPTAESARRYALFTSRRMYASWDAMNALTKLKAAIQKVENPPTSAFRPYFTVEMNHVYDAVLLTDYASNLNVAVSLVLNQEFFAADRLISVAQNNTLLGSSNLTYDLARYVQCELSKLRVR